MACPRFDANADAWLAVEQLEQALGGVQFSVERQLGAIEGDTIQLEQLYDDLQRYTRGCTVGVSAERPSRSWGVDRVSTWDGEPAHYPARDREPAHYRDREPAYYRMANPPAESPPRPESMFAGTVQPTSHMRSLLVCYFPREANKAMIRSAFVPFGPIDSVYLVHKQGKPACYGFVNFSDHPSAARALAAAEGEQVRLVDKRGVTWHVKAEWTTTPEIPKKPKKKRKKEEEAGTRTPPLDLSTLPRYPEQTFRSLPHRFAQLSYQVPVHM